MTEDMVERVAKALYEVHGFVRPWEHPKTQALWRSSKMNEARAAIEAMRAPAVILPQPLPRSLKDETGW